jgi:hypothetical protein
MRYSGAQSMGPAFGRPDDRLHANPETEDEQLLDSGSIRKADRRE